MSRLILIGLVLATVSTAAVAQIQVQINGQSVDFPTGVAPQMIGSRVLVPLRGVMEKLGADVKWDAPTRTVAASRGSQSLTLQIGDPHATVNGKSVTLDVAAQIISGATMVPLRFIGEALGADVKWIGATQTVSITISESNGGTGADSGGGASGGGNNGGAGNSGGLTGVAGYLPRPQPLELRYLYPSSGMLAMGMRLSGMFAGGESVDSTSVKVVMNGQDITSDCQVSKTRFEYAPAKPLARGSYRVSVEVRDLAGHTAQHEWSFRVQ